jgi:hypothetical protein
MSKPTGGGPGRAFAFAVEAARALGERRIASLDLTRLVLDRIERHNPTLNACVNVLAESALAPRRRPVSRSRGVSAGGGSGWRTRRSLGRGPRGFPRAFPGGQRVADGMSLAAF